MATLSEQAPTYEEWKRAETRPLRDGSWLFEEDLVFRHEDQLRAIFLSRYDATPVDDPAFRSITYCKDGQDSVWNVHRKLNITYCFGAFQNDQFRDLVVEQVRRSSLIWKRAGDVNFVEIAELSPEECNCLGASDQDGGCTSWTTQARIRIRQGTDADCTVDDGLGQNCPDGTTAMGVPPSTPLEVRIFPSAAENASILQRVVTHELGHVLGLGHEHLRYDQSIGEQGCDEPNAWRAVTDPDADSIMGYGHCDGLNDRDFPSPRDRLGVSYLYNLPRNAFPSYTTAQVDDILWFRPDIGDYDLWRASFKSDPMNNEIVFTADPVDCYGRDNNNQCFGGSGRIRPIPLEMTAQGLTDVIMYGPRGIPDVARVHTLAGSLNNHQATLPEVYDLPLPGRFVGSDSREEIWWVRPGTATDPVGIFSGGSYALNPDLSPGGDDPTVDHYFRPIVGLWHPGRGFATPNSQILWYRESPLSFVLTYATDSGIDQEVVGENCLFKPNVVQPIPLRGDFDGDDEMEIFWVSLSTGQHVLWRHLADMWDSIDPKICEQSAIAQVLSTEDDALDLSTVKPFVGDFDGDGSDDIFWYSPGSSQHPLWLDVGGTLKRRVVPEVLGDYTPVVGDFNGDLCDDILWFAPHEEFDEFAESPTTTGPTLGHIDGFSPLWRSNCDIENGTFTPQQEVDVPPGAYPVGYDPRSAGRF